MIDDEREVRRRRALYRANHRGTKELDVLIGRFAEARLPALDGAALDEFERFLVVADPTLQTWIFTPATVAASEFATLVGDIRRFHGLDGTDA